MFYLELPFLPVPRRFIPQHLVPLLACVITMSAAAKDEQRVLGVLESFDAVPLGPFQKGFLDFWRWDDAKRAEARTWSQLEIVKAPDPESGQCLRIVVNDGRALTEGSIALARMTPFLPPEADAIRLRVRVLRGEMAIYAGGPTAYYANSDVFTEPKTIRAADDADWEEVTLPLHAPLWRNFRRAGFSTDAPRCYYTRWAQEPMGLFLSPGSTGEMLVDRIDVIACGQGMPFRDFTPDQVELVKTVADFEDGDTTNAFTCYMAATETEWFEESWKRSKVLRFEPMQHRLHEGGLRGHRSLEFYGRTAEEVHCAGIRVNGAAAANGFAVTMRADAPQRRETLLDGEPVVPMDFLVFVAPADQPFAWSSVAATDEQRAMPGPGFDYQMTLRAIAGRSDLHFAIYQTRRYLKPGEWSRVILPATDFSCVYGQGTMRHPFTNHAPLDPAQMIAFAWLPPWCRSGSRDAPITLQIDRLDLVRLPGDAKAQRSFWQVDDVSQMHHRDEGRDAGRTRHYWLLEK